MGMEGDLEAPGDQRLEQMIVGYSSPAAISRRSVAELCE